ncbi:thiamine diphosphokinase [Periweissella ghanensis]|uniref:Thiamine diphosphokinase n=1 Tax=Periweissella ghanensis TaxID=467997 RepID=A0ABN8BMW9_9LACO|nr:thiamine diphosphokinase [Periweissella ghanensis]MCM0601734.1 thiamine diphosphokinase [Periweissella ghanensis]CAH0418166.1 Thiamine pyrophosphokinase [Periweissella ghanensis]
MQRLNILVGGPTDLWPEALVAGEIPGDWLGVDRGAIRLLEHGITPLVAIGDFDSISKDEKNTVAQQLRDIRVAQPEKDDTDTQLALTIAMTEFAAEEIYVYGATGGRIDHFLANVWTVTEARFAPIVERVRMIDNGNSLRFYLPGEHAITKEVDKKYLAFMNLTPVTNLTLIDELYPLTNWSSVAPKAWTSNEFTSAVNHFKFDTGIMLVMQCRDVQKIF